MKKNFIRIIILIAVIWLIFFIKDIPKYRFGYFVEGPELKYEHKTDNKNVFKLDNGNVFILGKNDDNGVYIPSELYNAKENEIEEIILPKNIYYWDNGVLLNNNKILITHAYDPSDLKYKDNKAYPYDSMVVLNLNTLKFEKSIKKKINKTYKPVRSFDIMDATLFDGKVFMHQKGRVEIYNINKNTSELININIGEFLNIDQVFFTENNKVLLFGNNKLSTDKEIGLKYGDLDYVYEYDYKTNTLKTAGQVIRREHPRRVMIDDNKIIIFGGKAVLLNSDLKYREFVKLREIEIYDINTKKAKVVAKLLEPRCYEFMGTGGFNGAKLGNKYFLITGGKCFLEPIFGIKSKTSPKDSEILDLETSKIKPGPKAKNELAGHQMVTLDNGNILIFLSQRAGYNKGTQLFKQWRISK